MSAEGYFPGPCVLYNTGLGSHGGGRNQGMSKALAMIFVLLTCPSHYAHDISWCLAWTPVNMLRFQRQFRPIITSLAIAVDHHFWVSFHIQKLNLRSFVFRILISVSSPTAALSPNFICSCQLELLCCSVACF